MDNNEDKTQQQPQAPIVIMGGRAFSLADMLDAENNPEVMAHIEAWLAKKEKAFDQAQKRKGRPRIRRK
jgi:hypothetical protein